MAIEYAAIRQAMRLHLGSQLYSPIPPAAARALPKEVRRVYDELAERGEVSGEKLYEAFLDRRMAEAGAGHTLTAKDLAALPQALRAVHAAVERDHEVARGLNEPFPGGRAQFATLFQRYLPALRARTVVGAIEQWQLVERLPPLVVALGERRHSIGELTVSAAETPTVAGEPMNVRGVGQGHAEGPYVLIEGPTDVDAAARLTDWRRDPQDRNADRTVHGLSLASQPVGARSADTITNYIEPSPRWQELAPAADRGKSALRHALDLLGENGEAWGRSAPIEDFTVDPVERLARVTDAVLDGGRHAEAIAAHFAGFKSERDRVAAEYFGRSNVMQICANIAAAVDKKKSRAIEITDDVVYRIEDSYRDKPGEDDEARTFVQGQGRLLTVREYRGRAWLAVRLDGLAKKPREFEAFVFEKIDRDDGVVKPAGRLHVDATGRVHHNSVPVELLYDLADSLQLTRVTVNVPSAGRYDKKSYSWRVALPAESPQSSAGGTSARARSRR